MSPLLVPYVFLLFSDEPKVVDSHINISLEKHRFNACTSVSAGSFNSPDRLTYSIH